MIPAGALLVPIGGLALGFARVTKFTAASTVGWIMIGYGIGSAVSAYGILAAGAG